MKAGDVAEEVGAPGFPDVGEMGGPAAVLVDRQLDIAPPRQFDELASNAKVLDERFLRQDVLSRIQGAAHEIDANVGMRRYVENPNAGVAQQGFEIVGNSRPRAMGVAPGSHDLQITRTDSPTVPADPSVP